MSTMAQKNEKMGKLVLAFGAVFALQLLAVAALRK